jgi:iron(III) transport system permease protein
MQETIPAIDSSVNSPDWYQRALARVSFPVWMRMPWLTLISLAIVAVVLLPLLYLAIRATTAGDEALDYLLQERTVEIMTNSLWLVLASTIGAGVIGVPLAWLTTRTDLPLRRMWLVLSLLTMVIPSYLGAVTYVAAFGPVGMLQQLLEPFGVQRLPQIQGFFGAWLAMVLFTYPYVVLPVRAALLNSDPALEEVGSSLGLNRWKIFWRITLPQLRPALASGLLLTAMYTLSDFGAVAVMRYNAFTRAIFLQINSFRMERAALLALVLVLLTLVLFILEYRYGSNRHNYKIGSGARRQSKVVRLGIWKIPALIFCGAVVAIGVAVPVGVMLTWLTTGSTISNPIELNMPELIANTTLVSALTALVVAIAALPLALLALRNRSRLHGGIVALAYTGNVLPGIVIALALVYFASNYMTGIYQTLFLLVIGFSTRFLPFSIGATRSALSQINPRFEEVARSLGLRGWQIGWRITLPLARAGIIAGAALVFLSGMKELPTTLILRPIGFETFPTRIWTFYNEAFLPQIGLPGLVLMLVSACGLVIILWRDHQRAR